MLGQLGHLLLHFTGSDNVSGRWYGFWSGFAGDLSIFAGLGFFVRHRNCHVKGCFRIGHTDPKHGHPACRKHHSQSHALGAS